MQNNLNCYRQTVSLYVILTLLILPILFIQVSFAQSGFEGEASWYGPGFAGNYTANGEIYDPSELTAAHKTLPFNTLLRVTNLANGLSVDVRINDRGPYIGNRVIDLSQAAAAKIGMELAGIGTIRAEFISEIGELDFPATASYVIQANEGLNAFDIAHPDYPEGTLLLAHSYKLSEPVLVRAINSTNIKNDSNTLLVSKSLFAEAGEELKIYHEAANTN